MIGIFCDKETEGGDRMNKIGVLVDIGGERDGLLRLLSALEEQKAFVETVLISPKNEKELFGLPCVSDAKEGFKLLQTSHVQLLSCDALPQSGYYEALSFRLKEETSCLTLLSACFAGGDIRPLVPFGKNLSAEELLKRGCNLVQAVFCRSDFERYLSASFESGAKQAEILSALIKERRVSVFCDLVMHKDCLATDGLLQEAASQTAKDAFAALCAYQSALEKAKKFPFAPLAKLKKRVKRLMQKGFVLAKKLYWVLEGFENEHFPHKYLD